MTKKEATGLIAIKLLFITILTFVLFIRDADILGSISIISSSIYYIIHAKFSYIYFSYNYEKFQSFSTIFTLVSAVLCAVVETFTPQMIAIVASIIIVTVSVIYTIYAYLYSTAEKEKRKRDNS